MADLDSDNPDDFETTAGSYRRQSGELGTAGAEMGQPGPVTPGVFTGRTQMANDINTALTTAGQKMTEAAQGVGAYGSVSSQVGKLYKRHRELSTQVLGGVINDGGETTGGN